MASRSGPMPCAGGGQCGAGVCVVAICGDGKLQLEEECDDANLKNGDGCSSLCNKEPLCTDSLKNGTETDVDCGGSCPACALGLKCAGSADCVSGNCGTGVCVNPGNSCSAPTKLDGTSCGVGKACKGAVCL